MARSAWLGTGTLLSLAALVWIGVENRELKGRLVERDERSRAQGHVVPPAAPAAPPGPEQPEAPKPRQPFQPVSRPGRLVETPVDPPLSRETKLTRKTAAGGQREEIAGELAPVEETRIEVVQLNAAQAESTGESLLKNGGFDKELAPWVCEEGRVVQDAGNPENSYLEVTSKEGRFHLSQDLQPNMASGRFQLSLRIRSALEGQYAGIRVGIRTQDGSERVIYTSAVNTSGEWRTFSIPFTWPRKPKAVGIVIEGDDAKAGFSIDDIVLKKIEGPSSAPQQ